MCVRRARLEEREAIVAEARKKVEAAEREARELEAEQERQVRLLGVACALPRRPGLCSITEGPNVY